MAFTGVVKAINLATVFVLPPLTALAIFGVLSIDTDLDSVVSHFRPGHHDGNTDGYRVIAQPAVSRRAGSHLLAWHMT